MAENGEKIGIVCCSNGMKKTNVEIIEKLKNVLLEMGLHPVFSDFIYEKDGVFSGTAGERACALMELYENDEIKSIFDISGGDVANGILPYLDYECIGKSSKLFWGYSDLTTVINAIYAKTGKPSVLYQIRNLVSSHKVQQTDDFRNTVLNGRDDLFQFRYHFIQNNEMHGIVIGGNIRCFLKLAGTEYMPDFKDKILLLESRGGTVPQMETYLSQLKQLGAFEQAAGVLLGTFSQMEAEQCIPTMESMIQYFVPKRLPVAVTKNIGHGSDSKGIMIGSTALFHE